MAHLHLGVFDARLFLVGVAGCYEPVERLDVFLHGVCLYRLSHQEHLLDQVREVRLGKFLLELELLKFEVRLVVKVFRADNGFFSKGLLCLRYFGVD